MTDTAEVGTAGASARAEYERRLEQDAARRRSNRWRRIAVTVATPFVVYALVRFALPAVIDGAFGLFAERAVAEAPRKMDTGPLHPVGLLLAAVATLGRARQLWGRRQTTAAWGKGAQGEVLTGRILDALPEGFAVRHDLRMPRSRGNIDHVVVGPTGVFTVETKNYQDGVHLSGGGVASGGRRREGIVDQAQRQAQAITALTGQVARPIVVVHGGVQRGWFTSPIVDGVHFCGPRDLVKALTRGDRPLSADVVAAAVDKLDSKNGPAAGPSAIAVPDDRCTCGGEWVERRRRSDNEAFLGCSRFPACRQTRSVVNDSDTA